MSIYNDVAGELVRFYSEGEFQPEALKARKEFADFVGVLDEEDPNDEMKFNQFADWYLFVRPLSKQQLAPIEYQLKHKKCPLSPDKEGLVQNLKESRYSLFEFLKIKKQDVYLRDLISAQKVIIKNSDVIHGFDSGVPFSARLIPHEDTFVFSTAFCFHPADAYKFIKAQIKLLNKMPAEESSAARPELILKLMRMRHRFDHFKKVPLNEIYTTESRLRF